MGAYNGRNSFDTFTHRKGKKTRRFHSVIYFILGILQKPLMFDPAIRYPPYNDSKIKWVKFLNSVKLPKIKWSYIAVVVLAVVVAYLYQR